MAAFFFFLGFERAIFDGFERDIGTHMRRAGHTHTDGREIEREKAHVDAWIEFGKLDYDT